MGLGHLEDIQVASLLQQDVKVRWNITANMIQSLLDKKALIGVYTVDHSHLT